MQHPHRSHVLQLDIQGTPQAWISRKADRTPEEAGMPLVLP
jgi:hypothetical protein